MILSENELFARFILLSGSKIYFFWQKYTSQTKYFFGSLINWSPWLCILFISTLNGFLLLRNPLHIKCSLIAFYPPSSVLLLILWIEFYNINIFSCVNNASLKLFQVAKVLFEHPVHFGITKELWLY